LFPLANGPATADLKTPDMASLSIFHVASPKLELMADLTWTKWSNIQQLVAVRKTGPTITTLRFGWDDTLRFGVGANYKLSGQTKLRFGVARDTTPTNDLERTPRLPDQDRTWLAFGLQYKPSKQGTLELGYAHEFVKDSTVNVPVPGLATCAAGCLRGNFKNKADIISVQYSHSF
jgi:long-chain fatty acid transport protein